MFEHRKQPLLTPREFLIRQLLYLLVASMIMVGSLVLGVLGYHYLEGLAWIDALVNASMLLGGMGPVNALHTVATPHAIYSRFLRDVLEPFHAPSLRCGRTPISNFWISLGTLSGSVQSKLSINVTLRPGIF